MNQREWRVAKQRFAESIFSGVKRYFGQNPPLARARIG